jgi:hypothetical protein
VLPCQCLFEAYVLEHHTLSGFMPTSMWVGHLCAGVEHCDCTTLAHSKVVADDAGVDLHAGDA